MFGAHGSATPGHSRPHSRPLRLTNYAPKSQTILPANFYPSNNTLIQALLVLLITNMISMGKTWSDLLKLCAASSSSSPLSNQMDPVVSLTCRSIFPPSPTETQLKCSPPHLYKYDSWLRNRAQTAPPDCSQTRFKSDQKTTPQTDSVYLPPHHHIIV